MAISIYAVLDIDNGMCHRIPLNDKTIQDAIENATEEGCFFLTYAEAEAYACETIEEIGKTFDDFMTDNLHLHIVKFDLDTSAIRQITGSIKYDITYSAEVITI